MKALLMILFSLVFAVPLLGNEEEIEQKFKEGNNQYAKSNFERAVSIYQSILESGYFSADLHYNLGNAYYKLDSIPKAVLHYEKALRLNPGMEDAEKNLAMANLKTIDKIEPIPDFFINKWWKSFLNLFHSDEWAKWAVSLMFLTLFGMIIYFFADRLLLRKLGFYIAIVSLVLSLGCWFMGEKKYSYLQNSTEAIVMTPTVNVYSSPTEGSTKLFVLHKGTKVDLESKRKEWIKVRIPDGNEGWMKLKEVSEI